MDPPYPNLRSFGTHPKMAADPPQHSDNDRSSGELCALGCPRSALLDHVQIEGFKSGSLSDITVHAMGDTYRLHRLILSRSSYFKNMFRGPWIEAHSPFVKLHFEDENINSEAMAMSLDYLYGYHPKLNVNNAFHVLAAASFLDLQDLCAMCTDFMISELSSNFLAFQVFAETQEYGIHGERVRNACWGYLCQSGAMELKEVLPKLSPQTLPALLTSDALWVPSEEKRFELALSTLVAKGALHRAELSEQGSSDSEAGLPTLSGPSEGKGKNLMNSSSHLKLESEVGNVSSKAGSEGCSTARDLQVELAGVVDCGAGDSDSRQPAQQTAYAQSNLEPTFSSGLEGSKTLKSSADTDASNTSCAYVAASIGSRTSVSMNGGLAMEGPSEDNLLYRLDNKWFTGEQSRHGSSMMSSSGYGIMPNDWGKSGMPTISRGGRVVGRRQIKNWAAENCGIGGEDYDTFVDIFEGGRLLYSNMSFEALINVRKQLQELGFPCKAVNDSLWLQMLLKQRVQEIGADTCKNCCNLNISCACRQPLGYYDGISAAGYCIQEQDQNNSNNIGSVYVTEPAQGDGNDLFRPVRVHVRGSVDGLAGIGRGNTFEPAAAWLPTRYVFSRVSFGVGNGNCLQALANDDSEARGDQGGDLSGDGLTALVRLSQGGSNAANIHGDLTARGYETDPQSKLSGTSVGGPSGNAVPMQMLDHTGDDFGFQWDSSSVSSGDDIGSQCDSSNGSSISLDMNTPLSHFPPFRFGVEFVDVHRLSDGQVKHSAEVFYAGSLWKVSVQAFNDVDPEGRRTLGLFLHRRKAELPDSLEKVHMHVDTREKVTARYQLICPSKRGLIVFEERCTLLPKAPKGRGYPSALLFDELPDYLQNEAFRVTAVVQLV